MAGRFDQVCIRVAGVVHATSFSGFCVSGLSARIERNEPKANRIKFPSAHKNGVGNIYSHVQIASERPYA